MLSKADQVMGRLDGMMTVLPNPKLFLFMCVRKEAVLSNRIEGTQSTLQDLLVAERKPLSPSPSKGEVGEVMNYVRAMEYGLERLADLPLSTRLFREIHKVLLEGVRGYRLTPGELRTTQNWIGPPGSTINDATFVPPPPNQVEQCLSDLEKFIHHQDDLPILVRVGLVHVQFETIHPFLDGNGRLGRLIITLMLCQDQVLAQPALYVSLFFARNRFDYYRHLQAVRDKGDWEGWLLFFLRGVAEVGEEAIGIAKRIIGLHEKHRKIIDEHIGRSAGNGNRVLDLLHQNPVLTIPQVVESTGMSHTVANRLIGRFTEMGILEELTKGKRNRVFVYRDLFRVFREGPDHSMG